MNQTKLKVELNDIRLNIKDLKTYKDVMIDITRSSKEYMAIQNELHKLEKTLQDAREKMYYKQDELRNKREELLNICTKEIDQKIRKQSLKAIELADRLTILNERGEANEKNTHPKK